jgi:hypothetical protein
VWAYSAIQVFRQVLTRKVLGLKSVRVTLLTFLGTNLGPWRIQFPIFAYFLVKFIFFAFCLCLGGDL